MYNNNGAFNWTKNKRQKRRTHLHACAGKINISLFSIHGRVLFRDENSAPVGHQWRWYFDTRARFFSLASMRAPKKRTRILGLEILRQGRRQRINIYGRQF